MENVTFDRYLPYAELTEAIFALAARFPDLFSVESIGKSFEGRDIWCVTATNSKTGPHDTKPAFEIDGNIHATEVSASMACLYFLRHLSQRYGLDKNVTKALDTRTYYVIPRVNPDGAEAYLAADPPKFLRSSTRPYPYDEEPFEGLADKDLDGDGRYLSMRIPDPLGPWKKHPEEPRLMVRRDPLEEDGEYYRLMPEGIIENWDGFTLFDKPNKERLDLNRNFPAHWRQEHEQRGAGPFPTSEPEIHSLVSFIASHKNITGGVQFHTYSGVLLRPYGTHPDEEMPAEDLWTYQAIGKKGTEVTGYPNISVYHEFRYHPKEVITGTSDDWMYDHLGQFAWTVEIWSPQREAGIKEYKYIDWYREHAFEDDLKMLKWSDEVLDGKGFVDWYEFDHPQLGKIELGGWDPLYAFRNPPPQFLEREVAKFPEWLLYNALIAPELSILALNVHDAGDNTYNIELVVDNVGWLPTYVSKKALEKKITRGVIVELELPDDAELLVGKQREDIGQLEGRHLTEVSPIYGYDPTSHRVRKVYTVKGSKGSSIKLTVRHDRAGRIEKEFKLQ